jgi:hypothetical protein
MRDPRIRPRDVLTEQFLTDALGRRRLSVKRIAAQTGFAEQTVSRYAHGHGIPIPSWTVNIDRLRLAEPVERGRTIPEMPAELGCGHNTVARRLAEYGLSTPRNRDLFRIEKAELEDGQCRLEPEADGTAFRVCPGHHPETATSL